MVPIGGGSALFQLVKSEYFNLQQNGERKDEVTRDQT